ncbi:hypothetical protein C8R43DRAFT_1029357 [Mycena crocata]|nr:hypothetical protein C8R43DRAFT_1029357 [Mycena crocata]
MKVRVSVICSGYLISPSQSSWICFGGSILSTAELSSARSGVDKRLVTTEGNFHTEYFSRHVFVVLDHRSFGIRIIQLKCTYFGQASHSDVCAPLQSQGKRNPSNSASAHPVQRSPPFLPVVHRILALPFEGPPLHQIRVRQRFRQRHPPSQQPRAPHRCTGTRP